MIIDKNVTVKITKQNIEYFKNLNYKVDLKDNIKIDISHLQQSSHIKINVKCDICENEYLLSFKNYNKNYKKYNVYTCLKCSNIKNKKTCQLKYGVDHQMKLESTKEKIKKTSFEKYGVDNPAKNLDVIKKNKTILYK